MNLDYSVIVVICFYIAFYSCRLMQIGISCLNGTEFKLHVIYWLFTTNIIPKQLWKAFLVGCNENIYQDTWWYVSCWTDICNHFYLDISRIPKFGRFEVKPHFKNFILRGNHQTSYRHHNSRSTKEAAGKKKNKKHLSVISLHIRLLISQGIFLSNNYCMNWVLKCNILIFYTQLC